jgi:hypothetical protein
MNNLIINTDKCTCVKSLLIYYLLVLNIKLLPPRCMAQQSKTSKSRHQHISILHLVQRGFGSHPAFYEMGPDGSFRLQSSFIMKLVTHFYPMPRRRTRGALPPLTHFHDVMSFIGDNGIFHSFNPSGRTMALGSTQPLT